MGNLGYRDNLKWEREESWPLMPQRRRKKVHGKLRSVFVAFATLPLFLSYAVRKTRPFHFEKRRAPFVPRNKKKLNEIK